MPTDLLTRAATMLREWRDTWAAAAVPTDVVDETSEVLEEIDRALKQTETVGGNSYGVVMAEQQYDPEHVAQSTELYRQWDELRKQGIHPVAVLGPEGWLGNGTSEWYSLPIVRVPVTGAYRPDMDKPRFIL